MKEKTTLSDNIDRSDDTDRLDLRSPKIRKVLGRRPAWHLRWGNTILAIIIGLLIIATAFIPYADGTLLSHLATLLWPLH